MSVNFIDPYGYKKILVWENSSPDSSFVSAYISLDMTPYTGMVVKYRPIASSTDIIMSDIIPMYCGEVLQFVGRQSAIYGGRRASLMPDRVWFGSAYNHSSTIQNNYAVPVAVYGVMGSPIPGMVGLSGNQIVVPNNPTSGMITNFVATKQSDGEDVVEALWNYTDIGNGWLLRTAVGTNTAAYLISETPIDVTNYSTITVRASFRNLQSASRIGLIAPSNIPTYGDSSGSAFTVSTLASNSDYTVWEGNVSLNIISLTGNYHLAILGQGNSVNNGKSMIQWARMTND